MIKGQGTKDSPLYADYVELMDVQYMIDEDNEENKDGIVLFLRNRYKDELFAIAITTENFREMFSSCVQIIEALDATL